MSLFDFTIMQTEGQQSMIAAAFDFVRSITFNFFIKKIALSKRTASVALH